LLKLQLSRRQQTPVASDDARIRIDQNRIVKAERGDAGRDLRDLGVGVGPRIPGVRDELFEWPVLDALGRGMRKHTSPSEDCLGNPSEGAPWAPA
jgi:hypothetical protein